MSCSLFFKLTFTLGKLFIFTLFRSNVLFVLYFHFSGYAEVHMTYPPTILNVFQSHFYGQYLQNHLIFSIFIVDF